MKKISALITATVLTANMPLVSFAMPRNQFDSGMSKGISYFDRGLYYEARDEFQWFCDANWGKMNAGQQKYALDYLDGTKLRIQKWEQFQQNTVTLKEGAPEKYGALYHITPEDCIKLIKQRYGVNVYRTWTSSTLFWFEGEGRSFVMDRWYVTNDVNAVEISETY